MAFLAVVREGLETALIFYSAVQGAAIDGGPLLALLGGIATAVVIGCADLRAARCGSTCRTFFTWTGALLILVAAGILKYGVHDLQEAGVLPGLNTLAFDISGVLDPTAWYAALLAGMFNITPTPTVLETIAWVAYAVPVLVLFLRPPRRKPGRRAPAPDTRRRRPRRSTSRGDTARCARTSYSRARRGRRSSAAPPRAPAAATSADGTARRRGRRPDRRQGHRHRLRGRHDRRSPAGTIDLHGHQQGQQGHRVLRLRRRATGSWARSRTSRPGLSRELHVELPAGTYETACKPGMIGKGIRGALTVTGSAAPLTDDAELADATDELPALREEPDRRAAGQDRRSSSTRSRPATSTKAKALFPVARTYWERIEPVAEIFGDLDPKIDGREEVIEEGMEFTGFHRIEKDLWVTERHLASPARSPTS